MLTQGDVLGRAHFVLLGAPRVEVVCFVVRSGASRVGEAVSFGRGNIADVGNRRLVFSEDLFLTRG